MSINYKTDIIPSTPFFIGEKKTYDLKAICVFAATGFFLDDDTYFQEQKVLKPASDYVINDFSNAIESNMPYFKWHYSPVERPLSQIVSEFASLFEKIIDEQVGNKKVILPLSGGLDSRTQAAALTYLKKNVQAYSYEFEDGHNETNYAEQIAKVCDFPFQKWIIPKGYLWKNIEHIAEINGCYTEFTHSRQAAVLDKFQHMGDVFSLGHWGDVLFDDMKVADDMSFDEQAAMLYKKVLKKGGMELAKALWKSWNIDGDFEKYLKTRIEFLHSQIKITNNANAQIRAFKSLFWAPRWTSVNLSYFQSVKPITLPYYDYRICEFICTIPEKYLVGRQIQIEYLKFRNPALAKITWQDHRPFNLYSYNWNHLPWNIPYRILQKSKKILFRSNSIVNNYENQFLGESNEKFLKHWLFDNKDFDAFINPELVKEFYTKFKNTNSLLYSHPVSTLLTFSLFCKINRNEE